MLRLPKPRQQPDRLHHFLLLQRNHAASPCRCRSCSRTAASSTSSCTGRPLRTIGHTAERNHRHSAGRNLSATGVRAFCRCNQLQQLLRIVQPLFEFWSQGLRCNLRRDAHIARQRIGSDELHFINSDRASRLVRANASLICLETSCPFDPATVKARTRRTKSSSVTSLEKCRLANPGVV